MVHFCTQIWMSVSLFNGASQEVESCPVLDDWVRLFQWLIIPGHSFIRDLGILKPVTRTTLSHVVKFSSKAPAVSHQHWYGLPSWGGQCLEQPAGLSSRGTSPAVMLAGAGSMAVEGALIICCVWPRWWPPSFCLPLRSCLHCNCTRLLFLQELEQQQQTRLPSLPGRLVPLYLPRFLKRRFASLVENTFGQTRCTWCYW